MFGVEVVVLLKRKVSSNRRTTAHLFLLQTCFLLNVLQSILGPLGQGRVRSPTDESVIERYATFPEAARQTLYWEGRRVCAGPFGVVAGKFLEEEEEPAEEERRKNEEYQVFGVFECKKKVFVDE